MVLRAIADAGIPWNLSYNPGLAEHIVPENEFIPTWLKRHPHRPIRHGM